MPEEPLSNEQQASELTLIEMFEKIYRDAVSVINIEVKDLVQNGKELQSLNLFNDSISKIAQVHRNLSNIYSLIFNKQNVLKEYGSQRLQKFDHGLMPIVDVMDDPNSTPQEIENYVLRGFRKYIGEPRTHPLINTRFLSEIEYMIYALKILVEPDYIPLGTLEEEELDEDIDRHIPSSVKMYVWQRDGGKCVQCGSQEKLEYDHIIPVSKGGSNTERNIQLLCEKCNRKKSATIQ